jgi:ribonuclease G
MKEEILINSTPREVRAAVLRDGVLQELIVERVTRRSRVGNVYKGKVSRVLPGMQAAFVDVGLERTAFLHASDIRHQNDQDDDAPVPDIRQLLREGDQLLVQVLKEPLGTKGARLTTFITIPSRCLVMLPNRSGIGISSLIEDED